MTVVLRGATLIDGTGGQPIHDASVTVEDEFITDVKQGRPVTDGETLELDGLTLLPGLIDGHTHLGAGLTGGTPTGTYSVAEIAAMVFRNAELALDAGFTSVRDLGGMDLGIVRAIDRGLIRGPRVFPSAAAIVQEGGHGVNAPPFTDCWCNLAIPGLHQLLTVCDSPDDVRRAVRINFRRGATQIKVIATGGVLTLTSQLDETQLSVAEIRAAVEEATAHNTYVTIHAHNCRGIHNGLAAGAKCVEHGTFLDEATADEMASAGAALVPTLAVVRVIKTDHKSMNVSEAVLPRLDGVEEGSTNAIRLARARRIPIGSGSDLLGPNQNRRGLELVLKADIEDPMSAIVSATSVNASIMLRQHLFGSVRPGLLADLIAVDGDPLSEPALFDDVNRVVLVMKGGQIVKDTRIGGSRPHTEWTAEVNADERR